MRSDQDLVDAVFNGDRAAFAVLVERYERPVRSVAIVILGNTDSADDVAQDAFTTSYERLATLTNRSAFRAWILKIAQRTAYQMVREQARNRAVANTTLEHSPETSNAASDTRTRSCNASLF
jgi:RNA polymerase sigma-70 factor (ECF subfamily)